ncbi:PREDICTED: phosphate transporter PHO1 homolog 1-like [Nelumbo nucifera]|uniref:Phosphate transporter PHO1 homolog 1-like n=1 Tax=Nelumbo nucifera TaxID=4432 RepID=A0A1U8AF75_NELNU|nr:PREDICTED: phosphate transporter PHO1 homolog 1-like [Nelumbo nucifera]
MVKFSKQFEGQLGPSFYGHHHREHGPIQVHKKLASLDSNGDMYETELLEQFNKKKLHHAEKMIRGAFTELYKGLGYLKTYRYIMSKLKPA